MSDGFWQALPAIIAAVFSGLAVIITAIVAALVTRTQAAQMAKLREVRDLQHVQTSELKEIHTTTNSMKDQLLSATAAAKYAEGMQAQRAIDMEVQHGIAHGIAHGKAHGKAALNVGVENGNAGTADEIPVATRAERGE